MTEQVVSEFSIPVDKLQEVERRITADFNKGLAREGDDVMIKMLVTYVHSLPDGSEEGDFLALDLGGSNFRVLLIKLRKGQPPEQIAEKFVIDDTTKQSTGVVLFDFIAKCVADFVKKQNIIKQLPLGFTFSFPVKQLSLTSGTLIRWTKDFTASGVVNENVVQLLKDAFDRRGDIDVDVVALVNDTTGTQLAVGYLDNNCQIGLILGTGTNACYLEQLSAVGKYTGDKDKYSQVIINCEWGAFGDDGNLDPWLTTYDKGLDELVQNKKQQLYEKMISGKYLGEIVRQALLALIKSGVLFGGKPSEKFDKFEAFESRFVSMIEAGDVGECKKIFKENFSIEASDEDCHNVKRVCAAVSTRAARLAGAGVVALVKKINKLDGCTVAVDGSLYKMHPTFPKNMGDAMNELAPGNKITMKLSEDGSGRGAAIVAAVACRLVQKD